MKENEAPEKIYVIIDPIWGSMSVNYNHNDTNNVEYVRTDAFIEKAVKWLEDNAINYWGTDAVDNGMMLEKFKEAMRQ